MFNHMDAMTSHIVQLLIFNINILSDPDIKVLAGLELTISKHLKTEEV